MIPGRTERVLADHPALGEDDEVDIGRAGRLRRRGQHGEDRRIGMVEQHCADRREAAQIVFVWEVVAVPGDDVERREAGLGPEQFAAPFDKERVRSIDILVGRTRRQEVARIGEAVGADRPAVRQREATAVILADVGAHRSVDEFDAEDDAARNDADLARLDVDDAELGAEADLALLRDDEEFTVGVIEVLAHHRLRDEHDMRSHAGLSVDVAGGGEGAHAGDEGELVLRHRRGRPAQLPDRQVGVLARRRGAPAALVDLCEAAVVLDRRPDAVEPGALVGRLRRREGRAGQLLGIEAVIAFLRRVAADRQRAGQRLGLEAVAEAGHVAGRHGGPPGGGFHAN